MFRLVPIAVALLVCLPAAARTLNGFELSPSSIPEEEILRGGPPRDGIPALSSPRAVSAEDSTWDDEDLVVGVVAGGEARAYPIAILVWHELVNDDLGEEPILVSYCPLCGTAIAFDRRVGGREREFGVSGLLYQSDLLMYDRETDSLWSQISAEAVTGPALGARLSMVRSKLERWGRWRAAHPDTSVLSTDTGHRRRYGQTPYRGYDRSQTLHFPAPRDPRYHPKMPTIGLRLPNGEARAYPKQEVLAAGGIAEERFAGHPVTVRWNAEAEVFEVDAPGPVEVVEGFWFAWAAFHPATTVFVATPERSETR